MLHHQLIVHSTHTHTHSHFVCLICILLSAHLLPSSHTLYAYTRAYTCTSSVLLLLQCKAEGDVCVRPVYYTYIGTHIGTCIRIIIMEECSSYSDVFRLGSCFFFFFFHNCIVRWFFFLLRAVQSCLHHKLQHGRWSTAGAKLIETLLQSLRKTGFSE